MNSYELGRKHQKEGLLTCGKDFLKLLDSFSQSIDSETGLSERESYLLGRLDGCISEGFDGKIETDAKAGKLDRLIKQALADYKDGKIREI